MEQEACFGPQSNLMSGRVARSAVRRRPTRLLREGSSSRSVPNLCNYGRHVGAPGRAAPHHHRDLRDAGGRHLRLVVEDAAEMVAVGKDLVLVRQVGAAGIDKVDAGQPVLLPDLRSPAPVKCFLTVIGK